MAMALQAEHGGSDEATGFAESRHLRVELAEIREEIEGLRAEVEALKKANLQVAGTSAEVKELRSWKKPVCPRNMFLKNNKIMKNGRVTFSLSLSLSLSLFPGASLLRFPSGGVKCNRSPRPTTATSASSSSRGNSLTLGMSRTGAFS